MNYSEKYEVHCAWASFTKRIYDCYEWNWYFTLSSKNSVSWRIFQDRLFWWLKMERRIIGHHFEHYWTIELQKRGAPHAHGILHNVPTNYGFKKRSIALWETYQSKKEQKFGDAKIEYYDRTQDQKLAWYLTKQRIKEDDCLIGSGSIWDVIGFSRGVTKKLKAVGLIR